MKHTNIINKGNVTVVQTLKFTGNIFEIGTENVEIKRISDKGVGFSSGDSPRI
jgi:hypothetical protein